MKKRSPIFFIYWSLIIHVALLVALDVSFRGEEPEHIFTNVTIEDMSFASTDISPQVSFGPARNSTSSDTPFAAERRLQKIAEIQNLEEPPLRREHQFDLLQQEDEIVLDPVLAEDRIKEVLPEDAAEEMERVEAAKKPERIEEAKPEPVRTRPELEIVKDHRIDLDPLKASREEIKPLDVNAEAIDAVRQKAVPKDVAISKSADKRREPQALEISEEVDVLPVSSVSSRETKNAVSRTLLPIVSHDRDAKPEQTAERRAFSSVPVAKRASLSPIGDIELSRLMDGAGPLLSGDHPAENGESGRNTGGTSSTAQYRENRKPIYPEVAKINGYEGTVHLRVQVLSDGTAGEIQIHKSSGYETLDEVAVKSVKRWKFQPATKDGEPMDSWVIIPIEFHLDRG